jgi:uncharacterized hydrophobic protein (TIGR00271 family)
VLHLRIVAPADRSADVIELLGSEPGATNVLLMRGAAVEPEGDVVMCDVAREAAHPLLARLRALGLTERGSIAVEQVDMALSRVADRAEEAAPGHPADALVWEEVTVRTSEESALSATFLAFMCIATMIAGVGVLLDQPILVVGAMVVGPEFGAVAGLCVALVRRQSALAGRSARALLVGFPVGIAVTVLATLLGRATGLVEPSMLDGSHPLTAFVSRPDAFSFVVAFLAGVAGMLSLTSAKSGALIGVLISVTTIPAAGYVGVAFALGHLAPAGGAALQLTINLCSMLVAGVCTLLVQGRLWQYARGRRSRHRPSTVGA